MFLICVLKGIMVKPIWYGLFRTNFLLPKTIFTISELKQFLVYPSWDLEWGSKHILDQGRYTHFMSSNVFVLEIWLNFFVWRRCLMFVSDT